MKKGTLIVESNIRIVIGLNDNFELFIRDLGRCQEIELCRADTETLFELLKKKQLAEGK